METAQADFLESKKIATIPEIWTCETFGKVIECPYRVRPEREGAMWFQQIKETLRNQKKILSATSIIAALVILLREISALFDLAKALFGF